MGTQEMRYVFGILFVSENVTGIVDGRCAFAKPGKTYSNIFIIFSGAYDDNIILMGKTQLGGKIFIDEGLGLSCRKPIKSVHISVMYAGVSFLNDIVSNEPTASCKCPNLAESQLLYFILPPPI